MESKLRESVQSLVDQGHGEAIGDLRFFPLVALESGARYGLDAQTRWILVPNEGAPVAIGPDTVHLLHEALEWKRSRFDDAIAEAARTLSLPDDDAVFAFPAVDLVRAVLVKRSTYLTRLALHWLLPSELRELRNEILTVTRDPMMPGPVKDIAGRLVVPV